MFWRLVPREIALILDGVSERRIHEHNERAWMAWQTSRLTAYAPPKQRQFPKLDTLTVDRKGKTKRRQTADEQIAIAQQWTVVTSGRV